MQNKIIEPLCMIRVISIPFVCSYSATPMKDTGKRDDEDLARIETNDIEDFDLDEDEQNVSCFFHSFLRRINIKC
jgi:hypothetical protein